VEIEEMVRPVVEEMAQATAAKRAADETAARELLQQWLSRS
jgi:BMFP domain-containing protein YqiC